MLKIGNRVFESRADVCQGWQIISSREVGDRIAALRSAQDTAEAILDRSWNRPGNRLGVDQALWFAEANEAIEVERLDLGSDFNPA